MQIKYALKFLFKIFFIHYSHTPLKFKRIAFLKASHFCWPSIFSPDLHIVKHKKTVNLFRTLQAQANNDFINFLKLFFPRKMVYIT